MAKKSFLIWYGKNYESLRSLFADYCRDTGTAMTDVNFEQFAMGMYHECK